MPTRPRELATLANDRLAERHRAPSDALRRPRGFAPQSPKRAVREMERAMRDLKLNGFIVNSHTNNEYLDDPKYWPILEAAEALDRCIYIHPRGPSDGLDGSAARSTAWIRGACGPMASRSARTRCA